ncbi:unnamed protein product [Closterium sp. NIES-53]
MDRGDLEGGNMDPLFPKQQELGQGERAGRAAGESEGLGTGGEGGEGVVRKGELQLELVAEEAEGEAASPGELEAQQHGSLAVLPSLLLHLPRLAKQEFVQLRGNGSQGFKRDPPGQSRGEGVEGRRTSGARTEKEATRWSSLLLASAQHSRGHEEPVAPAAGGRCGARALLGARRSGRCPVLRMSEIKIGKESGREIGRERGRGRELGEKRGRGRKRGRRRDRGAGDERERESRRFTGRDENGSVGTGKRTQFVLRCWKGADFASKTTGNEGARIITLISCETMNEDG